VLPVNIDVDTHPSTFRQVVVVAVMVAVVVAVMVAVVVAVMVAVVVAVMVVVVEQHFQHPVKTRYKMMLQRFLYIIRLFVRI
jgi:hypothetical protein